MDNSTLATSGGTSNLPVKKGFWKDIFGQFVTGEFWKGVLRTIAHEAMVAFFTSLGGVLVWYGKKKANPEIAQTTHNTYAQQSPASNAFSYPRPVTPYSPSYSSPAPTVPTAVEGFPGFGPGR